MLLQTLGDLFKKWFKPTKVSKAQICDLTEEQFVADLEESTQKWVRCHCPKTLVEALCLSENFKSAQADSQ